MSQSIMRCVCRLLIVATVLLPFSTASAGMIGTEQAVTGTSPERMLVSGYVERAEVAAELRRLGVEPRGAAARVAAMTDAEVAALAGEIQALPAGGTSFVLPLILAAIIAAAILYRYR